MEDKYGIAGKGSFGIIIGPALPNINNNDNQIDFPENITKIYANRNNYRNALNTSRKIKQLIPSLNINTNPYKRRYTIKNLPNSIKKNVKNYLKEKNSELNNNANLPILRMPNLGYDAGVINNNPELYRTLRQLPFRKICLEMYKCMNVVKAINAAGYIHGDIRETNLLFNLNNATMTIIDFDWLKPFNEIYNTYPEFFYPWPPECLFIFGRKKKDKQTRKYIYNVDIQSLFRQNMSFRSDNTILSYYETVMNKYDYYIPYDATKGMSHFLNNTEAFRSNAINEENFRNDAENYINDIRNELFNITKDYIDMYGLGIAFYNLLQHAWGINVRIHGLDINKHGNVISLADLSEGMKNGSIIISSIDKSNIDEIESFLNIRQFIFEELLPGIVHSNYTKRWTIDEALDRFKEKLDEIDKKILEKEQKIISDELKRLELMALLHNDKYKGFNNNQALKIKKLYSNSSNPFAILANNSSNNSSNNNSNHNSNNDNNSNGGKSNGGKSNGGKRKTRKNKRN